MGARLTLHPVGLNEEGRRILSVAMNVLEVSGCSVSYSDHLSEDTVAVIDVDSEEGRDFYEHSNDSHIKIVIAGDNRAYRADGLIRKPVRVQALRNLLSDISERILHQDYYDAEQFTAPSRELSTSDGTLPNASLFYVLVNAVSTNDLYRITWGDNLSPLLIHGPTRHLYTNLVQQELLKVSCAKGEQLQVTRLAEFEFMKQAQGFTSHRIEKVLWIASEFGTLGYMPVNMEEQKQFQLNEWPRFDVKHVKPEYLTLAAITTRRACTFSSLTRMTRIPLTTIFDFYHAAMVCGVVVQTSTQCMLKSDNVPVVPSLVSRIAKKLGLNFF